MQNEERIIIAATELFYRFGIKSITMDDVSKHLSMSKKTLYQFFRDKNDLVEKCCKTDLLNRLCSFEVIIGRAKDPIDELIQMMQFMESKFAQMNPNIFFDMQKYHPSAWSLFKEFKEKQLMKMIENNLKRGIDLGLYRKDINIPVMARLRIEEVEMGFNSMIYPPDKFKIPDVQMALFSHFLHGITTLKGHKLINLYRQITEED
jgi:TetR/AcrR family transcriptional regulator, cholesterol catabolism regulator